MKASLGRCICLALAAVSLPTAAPSDVPARRIRVDSVGANYRRLITATGTFRVHGEFAGESRSRTISLGGAVYHSTLTDTVGWIPVVASYVPGVATWPLVATPDAAAFVADRWAKALPTPPPTGPLIDHVYSLTGNSTVAYFKWPAQGGTFSLFDYGNATIEVAGHVVWLFDHGLKFEGPVTIKRPAGYSGPSSLVIVARPNGVEPYHPETGVWFWGGLQSPDVSVILVSDGGVQLEQINNFKQSLTVANLSVFANSVSMTGPKPGHLWRLERSASMDATIDWLVTHDALPGPSGPSPAPAGSPATAIALSALLATAGALSLQWARRRGAGSRS